LPASHRPIRACDFGLQCGVALVTRAVTDSLTSHMRIENPQRCDPLSVTGTRIPKLAERNSCSATESSRRDISKDAFKTHAGLKSVGLHSVSAHTAADVFRLFTWCLALHRGTSISISLHTYKRHSSPRIHLRNFT
jgi:hypothetical protein